MYLGYTYTPTAPDIPRDYAQYQLAGFLAVFLSNLFSALIFATRRDIVWCIAAVWICVSLWSERPKPAPVYVSSLPLSSYPYILIFIDILISIHCLCFACVVWCGRLRRWSSRRSTHWC